VAISRISAVVNDASDPSADPLMTCHLDSTDQQISKGIVRSALPVSIGLSAAPIIPAIISPAAGPSSNDAMETSQSLDAELVAFDGLEPPAPEDKPATLGTALLGVEAMRRGLRTLGIDLGKHKEMFETVKRVSRRASPEVVACNANATSRTVCSPCRACPTTEK
jgi:hypothetical protein